VLMLAGIDVAKLVSTASHPSSSSHSLLRRVVCHPGQPAPMIMGGLILRLQCQGCSGAGTQRNAVPANSFEPERRSGKYCWSQAER